MIELTVATWNIRKCVGLDRRRDPARIAEGIAALGADVVALQEADKRLGDRPAALSEADIAAGTDLRAVEIPGSGRSLGFHGNAVLVAPHVTVEAVKALDLPGLEPRGALVVGLSVAGRRLALAAVHLGLTRAFRRRQLEEIVARLPEGPESTIILGDFNEWRGETGLEPLVGFDVHAPGPTFHSARPVAPLDRLATRGGLSVGAVEVVRTPLTRMASDHLPVRAALRFANPSE